MLLLLDRLCVMVRGRWHLQGSRGRSRRHGSGLDRLSRLVGSSVLRQVRLRLLTSSSVVAGVLLLLLRPEVHLAHLLRQLLLRLLSLLRLLLRLLLRVDVLVMLVVLLDHLLHLVLAQHLRLLLLLRHHMLLVLLLHGQLLRHDHVASRLYHLLRLTLVALLNVPARHLLGLGHVLLLVGGVLLTLLGVPLAELLLLLGRLLRLLRLVALVELRLTCLLRLLSHSRLLGHSTQLAPRLLLSGLLHGHVRLGLGRLHLASGRWQGVLLLLLLLLLGLVGKCCGRLLLLELLLLLFFLARVGEGVGHAGRRILAGVLKVHSSPAAAGSWIRVRNLHDLRWGMESGVRGQVLILVVREGHE